MVAFRLDLKQGDQIDGKYQIVSHIGCGSYGDVFRVKNLAGEPYALKLLRLWEVPSDLHTVLADKFEQEYKTSTISSDYLVHSMDFGLLQGNPYLVMEFCPQGDLSQLKGKDMALLPRYAHDVLEGLYVLHTGGKVHRDLKPENVLIRQNGHAALTDFGVVGEMDKTKHQSEVGFWNKPKQIHGTPLYMAPEMFDRVGGGVTYLPTVDIFSFGVMLYELLTSGAFPFGTINGADELPVYQKKAREGVLDLTPLERVSHATNWIPLIQRCLSANYRERYQNVLEVLHDLQPLLDFVPCQHSATEVRSTAIERLVITQGENLGTTFCLEQCLSRHLGRMVKAGRDASNDIVLHERQATYISRFHFTIECSADGQHWTIRDGQWNRDKRKWVNSTNGTYLNATPVSSQGLTVYVGDIITVGGLKLKVE